MHFRGNRYNSPNHVLLATVVALVVASVFCARSLWIPASRIENLHIRAVVLSVTEAVAAHASITGLDTPVPRLRAVFLDRTGLSEHSSWDSRYFNRRDSARKLKEKPSPEPTEGIPDSPVDENMKRPDPPTIPREEEITAEAAEATPTAVPDESSEVNPGRSRIYSRENPLSVYFFGDSQVFSLGSGLSRLAGKDSAIDVDFLAIHSSGFVRDDFYDWPRKLSDTLTEKDYAAVVIMLGMNDYQYREKCRTMLDVAIARTGRVYWIGMPRVKNPSYNDNLSYIEAIHDSVAEEYSPDVLSRISLREIIPGDGNPYTETLELAPGHVQRIMSEDGSHFTVEGGQLVMRGLFDRLVRDFPFSELPVAHLPE